MNRETIDAFIVESEEAERLLRMLVDLCYNIHGHDGFSSDILFSIADLLKNHLDRTSAARSYFLKKEGWDLADYGIQGELAKLKYKYSPES